MPENCPSSNKNCRRGVPENYEGYVGLSMGNGGLGDILTNGLKSWFSNILWAHKTHSHAGGHWFESSSLHHT